MEFQKRGLPHVHMLIWLDSASKIYLKNNVDKFVSAEIPDPKKDPVGYAAVKGFYDTRTMWTPEYEISLHERSKVHTSFSEKVSACCL